MVCYSIEMLDTFETAGWFVLWLLLLVVVHYQFKVCIPVTIACMKVAESCALLLVIKLFVFFQLYGNDLGVDLIRNATASIVLHAKDYATKLEL